MRYEILIAGRGGQGVVLAGVIIGHAAIISGLNAAQSQSYGPEARGGKVRSEIIISDGPVGYPKVRRPNLLVTLSQEAYEAYINRLQEGGILIYDEDLVRPREAGRRIESYPIPATRMAEELGLRLSANMIILGAITSLSGVLKPMAVEEAIKKRVRRHLETNLKAFRRGLEYMERLKGHQRN